MGTLAQRGHATYPTSPSTNIFTNGSLQCIDGEESWTHSLGGQRTVIQGTSEA